MPRPIIIDTDPSPDDAVAFLAALASPEELEVLAITTVAGNVPVNLTSTNARKALELAGKTATPVYAGASAPLLRPLVTAEVVHGKTGFDGYDLPDPVTPLAAGFAPDAIVDLVMQRQRGEVTLCCLAPLTNIALAMAKEPRLAGHLREIVIMGGAFSEGGNITPAAEFNIYVDPEAAARVLRCGAPITMIPLDCTHQALTTAPRLENAGGRGLLSSSEVQQALRRAQIWMGGRTAARRDGDRLSDRAKDLLGEESERRSGVRERANVRYDRCGLVGRDG